MSPAARAQQQHSAPHGFEETSREPAGFRSRLPQTLSSADIRATMRQLHPQVQSCFERYRETGTVSLQVTVDPDGVAGAAVVGEFRDRPTGRCIAAGVNDLRFPAFAGEPLTFVYPFRLRTE